MIQPALRAKGTWTSLFAADAGADIEEVLPGFLRSRRWFGGKARTIERAALREVVVMPYGNAVAQLVFVEVIYRSASSEVYVLPLTFAAGDRAAELERDSADAVMASVEIDGGEAGVVFDALCDGDFCSALLQAVRSRGRFAGRAATLEAEPTAAFERLAGNVATLVPRVSAAEQSNTSVIFGDALILKLFRRSEQGTSPDLEMGRFLTEVCGFEHTPAVAGALELRRGPDEPVTVGLLQGFVANQGDAWRSTLDELGRFFARVVELGRAEPPDLTLPTWDIAERITQPMPAEAGDIIGSFLTTVDLLARRTAELHLALASDRVAPAFAPESFTEAYQQSLCESMQAAGAGAFGILEERSRELSGDLRERALAVLGLQPEFRRRTGALVDHPIAAERIRTHGDYHLGQVLCAGDDFMIIDFEGEPARSLAERRLKLSPLRDVAGMVRSFHYAAVSALEDANLRDWARFWYEWVSTRFVATYLDWARDGGFLPADVADTALLVDVYLLEKAVYELEYELNNRPDWLHIPVEGLFGLLSPRDL